MLTDKQKKKSRVNSRLFIWEMQFYVKVVPISVGRKYSVYNSQYFQFVKRDSLRQKTS